MRKETCSICGAKAVVLRGSCHFDQIGVPIVLRNVDLIKCRTCSSSDPIVENLEELTHAVARAVISKQAPLTGHEVRFLRKYLGKSAKEFSTGIGVEPETISRWENGHIPIGAVGDRLVRLVVINLSVALKSEQLRTWQIVKDIQERRARNRKGSEPQLQVDAVTGSFQYV